MSKLRRRIKSLEELLGVRFSPRDNRKGYDEHLVDWGLLKRLNDEVKRLNKKVFPKEHKDDSFSL